MQEAAGDDRSVAGQIARALAARIVSGELPPGERLRQDHVAAEFGASHVPVREAFQRLEAQGLVVLEPRRGVRVAALDPAAVLEVAEMRAALEALALRHAISRIDLAAARRAVDDEAKAESVAGLEEANRRFHQALTTPCTMPRLLAGIADLHQASARHLFATWRRLDWRSRSGEEHRAIVAAVEAGQPDAACSLLTEHIVAAGRALAQALRT